MASAGSRGRISVRMSSSIDLATSPLIVPRELRGKHLRMASRMIACRKSARLRARALWCRCSLLSSCLSLLATSLQQTSSKPRVKTWPLAPCKRLKQAVESGGRGGGRGDYIYEGEEEGSWQERA